MFINTMITEFTNQINIPEAGVEGLYDPERLNRTMTEIQEDVGEAIDIYADRMQLLACHLQINCRINGQVYGGVERNDHPQIQIYNPIGGHYDCVVKEESSSPPTIPNSPVQSNLSVTDEEISELLDNERGAVQLFDKVENQALLSETQLERLGLFIAIKNRESVHLSFESFWDSGFLLLSAPKALILSEEYSI